MELKTITIRKPDEVNLIVGQAHFIKTVDDLHEALVGAVPEIRFGVAFCEIVRGGAGSVERNGRGVDQARPRDHGRAGNRARIPHLAQERFPDQRADTDQGGS